MALSPEFSEILLAVATYPWGMAVLLNTVLIAPLLVLPPTLLTRWGAVHAWLLGVILWGTLGWRGYLVVLVYFGVGSLVTKIGYRVKAAQGIAEKRGGARGPENVWGSAAVGALCALGLAFLDNSWTLALQMAFVGSFAAKLSDTVSSEIGKAYGRRPILLTTLQPVPPGTEGAVSLEGTLAGVVGGLVLTLVGWGVGMVPVMGIPICLGAAFLANLVESWVGATWQGQWPWLTNEWVNGINTLVGAVLSGSGAWVFRTLI
ncbi:Putative membrane protein [Gloeomargarita lithophora Alchichica-D10]|uniref:Membrane protein n=1 Tax=Gloeomargarita lithophora Alchichica-D10 TaxID=1188229 RepID=A0A1J0AAQ6_9CYAN|nr:TIGR00297 family protein [Gloeomargarita lithophora]APB32985.1 Putative membrane protein [Gloeomargarita lithophora Alchichica-D10]